MQWVEIESPEGRKIPKWMRSAGLSDDGVVFVPGVIAGNENEAFLCAGYDGTTIVRYLNHTYFPVQWLAKEFPRTKEVCEKIERKVIEICSKSDADG